MTAAGPSNEETAAGSAAPLPARPLTEEEALDWMRQMLLDDGPAAGALWATEAFMAITHYAGPIGNGASPSPAAVEIVARLAVDMVANSDQMADHARCTPEQRRRLIVDRVMVYRDRLAHLFLFAHPPGCA